MPIKITHAALKLIASSALYKKKIAAAKMGISSKTASQKSLRRKRQTHIPQDFSAPLNPRFIFAEGLILLASSRCFISRRRRRGLINATASTSDNAEKATKIYSAEKNAFTAALQTENSKTKNITAVTDGTIFSCEPLSAALAESFMREFIKSP